MVVAVVHLPATTPWTPGMASHRAHPGPLSPGHGGDWEEIRGYIHRVGREHVSKFNIQKPTKKAERAGDNSCFQFYVHLYDDNEPW